MSQALQQVPASTDNASTIMERVLIAGDLGRLSAGDRVQYYRAVCSSVGLNPLTKPFEYINLNGKLTLYATKNCTDQLRSRERVSVTIVGRDITDDMYVVTARATTPDDRSDEDVGAVQLPKSGEARANAMMKAHTKAKRRVTLSICGLSFVDESELDAIPAARSVTVDHETGEIHGPAPAALPPAEDLETNVGALLAAYAGCKEDSVYRSLEETRLALWERVTKEGAKGTKARLKAAADAAATRVLATIDAPKSEDDSERQPGED